MLLQEKYLINLETESTNDTNEIEPNLTLEQNEKLYSVYVNILIKLQCEYSRAKLNRYICRSIPEINLEIDKYKEFLEETAAHIVKQKKFSFNLTTQKK